MYSMCKQIIIKTKSKPNTVNLNLINCVQLLCRHFPAAAEQPVGAEYLEAKPN